MHPLSNCKDTGEEHSSLHNGKHTRHTHTTRIQNTTLYSDGTTYIEQHRSKGVHPNAPPPCANNHCRIRYEQCFRHNKHTHTNQKAASDEHLQLHALTFKHKHITYFTTPRIKYSNNARHKQHSHRPSHSHYIGHNASRRHIHTYIVSNYLDTIVNNKILRSPQDINRSEETHPGLIHRTLAQVRSIITVSQFIFTQS